MNSAHGVRIAAAGIARLAHHQTNEELAERLGMAASDIEAMTGVRRRYVGPDEMTLPQLHALACHEALEGQPAPDLIINASVGFHQLIPDTTVFIQRELGLRGVPGFSVHGTCISFLYALQLADAQVRCGAYRRVLITSAELNTRVRDFSQPESAALLGDAGAAVLLEACEEPRAGVTRCSIRTYPEHAELTEVRGFGLRNHPLAEQTQPRDYLFAMDGPGVLKAGAKLFLRHMAEFMRGAQITPEDVDLVVPHQPSGKGLSFLARCGFSPDKTIHVLADYGNCAAVSIPLALAIALRDGRVSPGDRLLLLGTAAGLSVGALLFQA